LAGGEVAELLESLMGLAARSAPSRPLCGPREPALRKARVCYDHLADELGVLMYEEMLRHGILERLDGAPRLTEQGGAWCARIGIDVHHAAGRKRSLCRACLDWSERRHHLAGWLGAALLKHILDMGWAQREQESRAITFSTEGEQSLRALFQRSGASDPTAAELSPAELQAAAWPEET